MAVSDATDLLPLWLLNLLTTVIVLATIEFGRRLARYRRKESRDEEQGAAGVPVGATLSLLAFLLAFTFGMSAARFENRKSIVLQEANAIGTVYLRTGFLPDPIRDEARGALRAYLALRVGGASMIMDPQNMVTAAGLQDQLWNLATTAQATNNSVSIGLFTDSLNEMIDIDSMRVAANRNRIPDSIWLMLAIVTVFSMMAMGYQFGLGETRNWIPTILMVMAFSTVIMLIADLDRPQIGLVQVSQQPLLDLSTRMQSTP